MYEAWDRFEDAFDRRYGGPVRALVWRIAVSILLPVAWLCGTLLYVGFWAHGLSLGQEVIVGLVSVLVLFAGLATTWVTFGLELGPCWLDG